MRRADAAAKRARDIAIAERGWDDQEARDEEEDDGDDDESDSSDDESDTSLDEDLSSDEPKGHAQPLEGERMNYVEAFAPSELVDILLRARASDVVSIPVARKCAWTEHFVVGTARSPRHIRMLAGAVLHAVKKRTKYVVGTQLRPSIEGADGPDGEEGDDHWMVVDCGSCVVHVFSAPARERYDLEGLWAPGVTLERRNPEDGALTIDTIAPLDEEGEEGSGADGVGPDGTPEVDLEHMRSLDEYDDEYVEPPDWESSLTDLENRRAKRAGEKKGVERRRGVRVQGRAPGRGLMRVRGRTTDESAVMKSVREITLLSREFLRHVSSRPRAVSSEKRARGARASRAWRRRPRGCRFGCWRSR